MPVIKQAASPVTDRFNYADVETQASRLLELAREEASRILQKARDEAETARSRGFEQGHVEGYQKGHEAGVIEGALVGRDQAQKEHTEQIQQLFETLDATLRSIEADRGGLERRASSEITQLALAISDKVCKRAGTFNPEICVANVESALKLVLRSHDIRIAVHPDTFSHVQRMLPTFERKWPALKHTELIEDETVTPGGCVVSTAGGLVDADLETQLQRLAEDLVPGGVKQIGAGS